MSRIHDEWPVTSRLGEFRGRRGISAASLAEAAGVSRQTIHAIEAGSYLPNTAVALKLARALGASVEEMFSLADEAPAGEALATAVMLPGAPKPVAGQPVALCRVGGRTVAAPPSPVNWSFPASDAVVERASAVRPFQPGADYGNRLLIAGCDPAISVLARHARAAGVELVLAHRNSSQALDLLHAGMAHIAGVHLRDERSGESNLPEIARRFGKRAVAVVSFAVWEEGIVTARGNPKAIRGAEDLARPDIAVVNREVGAGSRRLLDAQLAHLGIAHARIRGYERTAPGHLAAAAQVAAGAVDCCIATRASARLFGLGFVPLAEERYDLVLKRRDLSLAPVQALMEALGRAAFRREVEGHGGYDTRVAGNRLL